MHEEQSVRYIYVKAQLANPARMNRWAEIEVLADTVSRLSIIPRDILDALDIEPGGTRRFRALGGGERETAGVVFRYGDSVAPAPVVVGEDGDMPIMGLRALESLGYQVDPLTGGLTSGEIAL